MTADVIRINFIPRLMECMECENETFTMHVDGSIRCDNCSGVINAKWERLTSSSQPTVEAPSGAA